MRLFEQLRTDYQRALLNRNTEQVRFIANYIDPPFTFLEVTGLKEEILRGLTLLSTRNTSEQALRQSVDRLNQGCRVLIAELEDKMQPVTGMAG
jgi:hypothetical protein